MRLRAKHKKISRATIYRTLELMVDSGIVGPLRIGEAGYRYERLRAGDHHDHLICDQCGRVIEFFEPRIESLQDEVCERYGFVLLSHSHQMRGICRQCRPRVSRESAAAGPCLPRRAGRLRVSPPADPWPSESRVSRLPPRDLLRLVSVLSALLVSSGAKPATAPARVDAMRKGKLQTIDPGVDDKRLLIDEREFQQALTVMQRQGNTLSTVVRDAWDCRQVLETLTKKEPTKATKPFLSIGGHITLDELKESLDRTAMANGYANRFLMAFIHRSKELPLGGDDVDLTGLIERGARRHRWLPRVERVNLTDGAKQLWCEIYPVLSAGQPGLLGAITARAEAQTMRLALIYALLDGVGEIDRVHIQAGLAMWAYCEASARYIFGDLLGNKTADAILATLRRRAPSGLTRSEISDVFGRNRSSGDIFQALELLLTSGKARFVTTPSGRRGGRPLETWYAT